MGMEGLTMKNRNQQCADCGSTWRRRDFATCQICQHKKAVKPVLAMIRNINTQIREVV
jgi:hypothetical protein